MRFFVASEALNAPGTWRIAAVVTRNDGALFRATFYLQISAGGR